MTANFPVVVVFTFSSSSISLRSAASRLSLASFAYLPFRLVDVVVEHKFERSQRPSWAKEWEVKLCSPVAVAAADPAREGGIL